MAAAGPPHVGGGRSRSWRAGARAPAPAAGGAARTTFCSTPRPARSPESSTWRQLGRADRHADLALAARELEIDEDPWFGPQYSERFLERYGLRHVDKDKMVFYQLLDEFF
ncbi:hypothetical protein SALBM135S_01591 [Streptomyces alboniger]